MGITCDEVEHRLSQHGYTVVHRTEGHALYEHHGDHIVVPHHSRELSSWTARAIEWSLEPRLGRRWLTAAPPTVATTPSPRLDPTAPHRLLLSLVVRAEPDHTAWNAFVVEEPRIITFGATLAETRSRATDAAGAWFAGRAQVELQQFLQLDAETQGWIDHATTPAPSAARRAEARHHLGLLGIAEPDITELLDGPPSGGDRPWPSRRS